MTTEDLKDRLMAVHLANASDTSPRLIHDEPENSAFDSAKGLARAIVYGACVWAIITVIYLFLTAGG